MVTITVMGIVLLSNKPNEQRRGGATTDKNMRTGPSNKDNAGEVSILEQLYQLLNTK